MKQNPVKTVAQHQGTHVTCQQCQNGMVWDSEKGIHVLREDYEFQHWTGESPDLMRRIRDAVSDVFEIEVCKNNLVRLVPMAVHEVKMIRVMLRHLAKVAGKPVFDQDIKEYEKVISNWKELLTKASKKFPELELETV